MIWNNFKCAICALAFTILSSSSEAQLAEWLVAINHSYPINDVATDNEGSIYIVGNNFSSIADTTLLDSIEISGKTYDSPHLKKGPKYFLAKIDSNAQLQWVKMIQQGHFGIPYQTDGVFQVTTDKNNGVIFNIEFYDTLFVENDTTIISQSPYTSNLNTVYQNALIKYDKNGNFKMATVIPTRLWTQGREYGKIESDPLNNIYFRFGPDTNLNTITSAILKFDQFGQFVDSFHSVNPSDFTVNKQGRVYVGKDYGNEFLLEYDASANYIQSKLTNVGNIKAEIIKSDHLNNVILFCKSEDSLIIIDTDTIKLTSYGGSFLLSMSQSLTVNWTRKLESVSLNGDLTINQNNDIIFTNLGLIDGAKRVLSIPGKHQNFPNSFITKIDINGHFIWTKSIEYFDGFMNPDITCDFDDHIYFSGYGQHPWYFAPNDFEQDSCFIDQLSTHGGKGFLLKLADGTNQVSGYVFEDKNSNGTPDSNDRFLAHQKIYINNNYLVQSDSSGYFTMYVPNGNYSIAIKDTFSLFNFNPSTHTAMFSAGKANDTNNHFILIPDSTVGFKDNFENQEISLYPNPSNGMINVSIKEPTNNVQVRVYNLQGVMMQEHKYISNSNLQLSLPDSKGLYFVEIRIDDEIPAIYKVIRE